MWPKAAITALTLAFVAACAGGPSGSRASSSPSPRAPTLEGIVGEYGLVAVDGNAIPYAPTPRGRSVNAPAWPVIAGILLVQANGTFQVQTSYSTNVAGDTRSFGFAGTCFSAGSGFRMSWEGGGQTGMSLRGDTLVVDNDGTLFAYLRR